MVLGSVYCESLRGSFWVLCICIFSITMRLLFQMVMWGVLDFVVYLMLLGIVSHSYCSLCLEMVIKCQPMLS